MSQQGQKQQQDKGDMLRSFMLGTKELDDKVVEFFYDRGQYAILDVLGEEKVEVYKSRNMQEAYTKWNVYIGRKKERPSKNTNAQAEGMEATPSTPKNASSQQAKNQPVQQVKSQPTQQPKSQSVQQPKSNREVLAAEMKEQCGDMAAPAKKRRHRSRNKNRQGGNANGGNEA